MRSFIVMGMFAASIAHADWGDYEEKRDLRLDAAGVTHFSVDAGPGSLKVRGNESAAAIVVVAIVQVDENDEDKAKEIIRERMTLTLERDGDSAQLVSHFKGGYWGNGDGAVALEIEMPAGIPLRIDDGSGSITVEDLTADVSVTDGSGSLKIHDVGAIEVDDGSGSIEIIGAGGDVSIVDGSGSIRVREVRGTVTIHDGSGSIQVEDVDNDVVIEEAGSGSVSVADVRGNYEQDG